MKFRVFDETLGTANESFKIYTGYLSPLVSSLFITHTMNQPYDLAPTDFLAFMEKPFIDLAKMEPKLVYGSVPVKGRWGKSKRELEWKITLDDQIRENPHIVLGNDSCYLHYQKCRVCSLCNGATILSEDHFYVRREYEVSSALFDPVPISDWFVPNKEVDRFSWAIAKPAFEFLCERRRQANTYSEGTDIDGHEIALIGDAYYFVAKFVPVKNANNKAQ